MRRPGSAVSRLESARISGKEWGSKRRTLTFHVLLNGVKARIEDYKGDRGQSGTRKLRESVQQRCEKASRRTRRHPTSFRCARAQMSARRDPCDGDGPESSLDKNVVEAQLALELDGCGHAGQASAHDDAAEGRSSALDASTEPETKCETDAV